MRFLKIKTKLLQSIIFLFSILLTPNILLSGDNDLQSSIAQVSLQSDSFNPGEVILHWTAPGNNGYIGRAAGYDIRYQAYARGPIDTETEWHNATRLVGEPSPAMAGEPESMTYSGLPFGASYYFCLKTYDSAGNYSVLSNSPLLTVGDTLICPYLPGDANADGAYNLIDVGFIVRFLYKDGILPYPLEAADTDGSGSINLRDVSYIITDLYRDGPEPVCNQGY
jgi:hypothetical protein